jgi:signal transduction histidine kinase
MGPGVRLKLVLLSVAVLVVVSFGFTALSLSLTRGWIEEDLRERAIAFAREIAATIGDRRELESTALLHEQIRQILGIRRNVGQLDILAFDGAGARIVATSHADRRLPFTRVEVARVQQGQVVSRLIAGAEERYWEVMAPITLAGMPAGAAAARFSLERADQAAARTRAWAFALTAASVLVMALLMSFAIGQVVDRPVRRFVEAIARIRTGETSATVPVGARDEFGVMAGHFNEMMARINQFSGELKLRVTEAVAEADQRYQEVQRLNEQLFELGRRLSHAERLAVSGRIMAEVAHEVGTPLHSVAGHLELLRRQLPPEALTDDARRRLDVIESQLGRVTGIITQLLDVTRRSAGPPARVDVNHLLRETLELVRPGMSAAGLILRVEAAPEIPAVHGHASQLQQVILNLLTNAMDATAPGGRVEVATRTDPDRGQVVVEVRDSGQGMGAAERRQIFEPFFSTKEPGRGSGLGLFISAQIVRDHKGGIEVESAPGRGSVFRVCLPAAGGMA